MLLAAIPASAVRLEGSQAATHPRKSCDQHPWTDPHTLITKSLGTRICPQNDAKEEKCSELNFPLSCVQGFASQGTQTLSSDH